MSAYTTNDLPVVVIGAGPVGLAAAAHLLERGLEPLVLEAGERAGAAVAQWGHVRLFSPWAYNVDAAAAPAAGADRLDRARPRTLPDRRGAGRAVPRRRWPPPSATPRIRTGARVVAVSRRGRGQDPHHRPGGPALPGPRP